MADILLLEDSDALRRVLAHALREDGHEVTARENGTVSYDRELIRQMQMLITDIDMPGVNGIEAILTIQKIQPNVKIIAMSGAGMGDRDDYLNACSDLGDISILQKPFDPDTLLENVRTLLAA